MYGFPRPSPGSQQPSNPLASRIGRAMGWIFMDAASARFGTLLIGLVLARMMGPAELGVFGIAVVVLLAVHSIGQFGMGTALAVWRDDAGADGGHRDHGRPHHQRCRLRGLLRGRARATPRPWASRPRPA